MLGEPVVISEQMFIGPDGRNKLVAEGRHRPNLRLSHILLMADAIRDPDEV